MRSPRSGSVGTVGSVRSLGWVGWVGLSRRLTAQQERLRLRAPSRSLLPFAGSLAFAFGLLFDVSWGRVQFELGLRLNWQFAIALQPDEGGGQNLLPGFKPLAICCTLMDRADLVGD